MYVHIHIHIYIYIYIYIERERERERFPESMCRSLKCVSISYSASGNIFIMYQVLGLHLSIRYPISRERHYLTQRVARSKQYMYICIYVCIYRERERERERERKREKERVSVCVCVCVREREYLTQRVAR